MAVGSRANGLLLVWTGTVLWSTAGFFVRLIDLDLWTLLAWRSLFGAAALLLILFWRARGRPGASFAGVARFGGGVGLLAVLCSAFSMFAYVAAITFTTVANVLTVYATVPFVAAGLAYLMMGERIGRRVAVASLLALVGIAAMAGGSLEPRDVTGNALAFLMTLTFASVLVIARRHPTLDMAAVNCCAAALCAAVAMPLAGPVPGVVKLAELAAFGVTTSGIAYLLFLTGGRAIPSSEAGLIGLADIVIGPLLVWLAFAETPSRATLIGGGIVGAAVLWYLAGLSGERRAERKRAERRAEGAQKPVAIRE